MRNIKGGIRMKAGDLVFVRGSGFIENAIRYFDSGEFSHVALAVSPTEIIEAQFGELSQIKEMTYTDCDIVDLGFNDAQRKLIAKIAPKFTGRPYDKWQIIWYIIRRYIRIGERDVFNDPNLYICSELVFDILNGANLLPQPCKINDDVTPNELYFYIKHTFKTHEETV